MVQHWHDRPAVVTASGMIGSFRDSEREQAEVFRRFQDLVKIYEKCGEVLTDYNLEAAFRRAPATETQTQQETVDKARNEDFQKGRSNYIVVPGITSHAFVVMGFGHERYRGVFNSFDVTYDYAQPNTVRFTFAFTVVDRDDVTFDLLDTAVAIGNIHQTARRKL